MCLWWWQEGKAGGGKERQEVPGELSQECGRGYVRREGSGTRRDRGVLGKGESGKFRQKVKAKNSRGGGDQKEYEESWFGR